MNDKPTGKDYVGSDDLYADVQRTMRLCAEMNSGYHTEAEVRDYLCEITRGEVPDTVRVFPPLNINYGPDVRLRENHPKASGSCFWRPMTVKCWCNPIPK